MAYFPSNFFKSYFNWNQLEFMAIIFYLVISFLAMQERQDHRGGHFRVVEISEITLFF